MCKYERQHDKTDKITCCAQRRLRSAWAFTQSDQILHCALNGWLRTQGFFIRTAKTLIRLGRCPGWSEYSLGCWFCHAAIQLLFEKCRYRISPYLKKRTFLSASPSISLIWKWVIHIPYNCFLIFTFPGLVQRTERRRTWVISLICLKTGGWKMLGRYCTFSVTVLQILDTRIYLTKIFFECKKIDLRYLLCKNQSSRRFWSIVIFPSKSGAKNCMQKILEPLEMSYCNTKPTKWLCPVWSESSLCAEWVAKDPRFRHADREDSDQTGQMPRLIWVFAGCTVILLVLSWGGSNLEDHWAR